MLADDDDENDDDDDENDELLENILEVVRETVDAVVTLKTVTDIINRIVGKLKLNVVIDFNF